ncbi:MAG: RNA-binding S4 domain-containing protein [bacterium]
MAEEVRIDKFLWSVRLFKTRSLAAEACKKGKVLIEGTEMKPSRMVHIGDIIQLRQPPVIFSYRVLQLAQNRMGAKLVPDYLENITPQDQLQVLELMKLEQKNGRARGEGRPTKKDRRDLESLFEN